jgi:hypothetical protein
LRFAGQMAEDLRPQWGSRGRGFASGEKARESGTGDGVRLAQVSDEKIQQDLRFYVKLSLVGG